MLRRSLKALPAPLHITLSNFYCLIAAYVSVPRDQYQSPSIACIRQSITACVFLDIVYQNNTLLFLNTFHTYLHPSIHPLHPLPTLHSHLPPTPYIPWWFLMPTVLRKNLPSFYVQHSSTPRISPSLSQCTAPWCGFVRWCGGPPGLTTASPWLASLDMWSLGRTILWICRSVKG